MNADFHIVPNCVKIIIYMNNNMIFFFFLMYQQKWQALYSPWLFYTRYLYLYHLCDSVLFLFPAKAQVYEKVSLQGIQQLVHRSYQTLALWKLLCDHQFSLIMSELPKVHVCSNTSPTLQTDTDAHTSSLQCLSLYLPEYNNCVFKQKSGVQCVSTPLFLAH